MIETYTKKYIKKSDNHLYIAPDISLQPYIAHYTFTFKKENKDIPKDSVLHIVPDLSGCMVMLLGEQRMHMWGPMTKVVTLENDLNESKDRFFIEFLPGGLYAFVQDTMDTYVDKRLPLVEVLPDLQQALQQILNKVTTYDALVEEINILCKNYLKRNKEDKVYQDFIRIVQEEDFTVASLKDYFNVSERQIYRYFKKYIGISYTKYKKIRNINRLLPELLDTSLITVAHQNEYFDQAHFNHIFKEIFHTTPTKYIENMSEFYNEVYKF